MSLQGFNGNYPKDPPTFLTSKVREVLRIARGKKLTAREITTQLGQDAGTFGNPSYEMMDVIRALAQLNEWHEVHREMPTKERPDVTYWIEPPKDKCAVCGEWECRRHG